MKPGRAALDEERFDLSVGVVARPDDHHVGERSVAYPLLLAVDDPRGPVAAGARLEAHRVRPVVGLGECPRTDRVQARERAEPAVALLVGAELGDRSQAEAG